MSYQRESIYAGRTKIGTNLSTMSMSHSDAGNAMRMGIFSGIVQIIKQAHNKKARKRRTRMGSPRSWDGKE